MILVGKLGNYCTQLNCIMFWVWVEGFLGGCDEGEKVCKDLFMFFIFCCLCLYEYE